jgi:hypothetical protein
LRRGASGPSKHLHVLQGEDFEAAAISEAPREAVITALTAPGSRSRIERGALGISRFDSIGAVRWLRRAWARSIIPLRRSDELRRAVNGTFRDQGRSHVVILGRI